MVKVLWWKPNIYNALPGLRELCEKNIAPHNREEYHSKSKEINRIRRSDLKEWLWNGSEWHALPFCIKRRPNCYDKNFLNLN